MRCKCRSKGHHFYREKNSIGKLMIWMVSASGTYLYCETWTYWLQQLNANTPHALHFLYCSSRQATLLWEAYLSSTGFPLYTKYPEYLFCPSPLQGETVSTLSLLPFHKKKKVSFIPFIQNSVLWLPVSSVSNTKVTPNCIWKQAVKLLFSECLQVTLAELNLRYDDPLFSKYYQVALMSHP